MPTNHYNLPKANKKCPRTSKTLTGIIQALTTVIRSLRLQGLTVLLFKFARWQKNMHPQCSTNSSQRAYLSCSVQCSESSSSLNNRWILGYDVSHRTQIMCSDETNNSVWIGKQCSNLICRPINASCFTSDHYAKCLAYRPCFTGWEKSQRMSTIQYKPAKLLPVHCTDLHTRMGFSAGCGRDTGVMLWNSKYHLWRRLGIILGSGARSIKYLVLDPWVSLLTWD